MESLDGAYMHMGRTRLTEAGIPLEAADHDHHVQPSNRAVDRLPTDLLIAFGNCFSNAKIAS